MPEEVMAIAIVAIVFGSIVTIVKSVLSYRERTRFGTSSRQLERSSSAEGTSLTTSELEDMMRRAVADATAPLQTRMARLEKQVSAPRTLSDTDLMHEPLDPAVPVRSKTIGGREQ